MPISYQAAREQLEKEFAAIEEEVLRGNLPTTNDDTLAGLFDEVFASTTQAYREVLIGCILAKLQDTTIDVHKPYK